MATLVDGTTRCRGRPVVEHAPEVTEEAKRKDHPWASIDNPRSIWLTKDSIVAALSEVGLDVCYTGFPNDAFAQSNPDRVMFVAKRRQGRR